MQPKQHEKKLQEQHQTHFFPLLPMENDDDEVCVPAAGENHHNPSDSHNHIDSSNSKFLCALSSLFKTKSTPTEEECRKNLQRIGLEISKIQQMIETTQNSAVQSACTHRMAKLNYEKRFYQIIKEQYKIRQMEKETKTGSVKFACQERLKQLIHELESLNLKKEELDLKTSQNGSNSNWYEKATQYVNFNREDRLPQQQTLDEYNSCHQYPYYDQQTNHLSQQHPKECQRDFYRSDGYQHTSHSSIKHQPTHHSPAQHENRVSPLYLQQQIHSASLSNHHNQYATHNIHNCSRNNLQPQPGQRLPLAKPIPKQEGLNKFMSYIAP